MPPPLLTCTSESSLSLSILLLSSLCSVFAFVFSPSPQQQTLPFPPPSSLRPPHGRGAAHCLRASALCRGLLGCSVDGRKKKKGTGIKPLLAPYPPFAGRLYRFHSAHGRTVFLSIARVRHRYHNHAGALVMAPSSSSKLPSSDNQQSDWTRRIRKSDVYPSSLGAICARVEALRCRWRDGEAANIVPITQAVCSPLYLRLDVDKALALELLGPAAEYQQCSAPMGERDAALCVLSVAQLLSRLHAEGVVHGHVQAGVVLHHTSDARRVVVTECELPMSALVPHGGVGSDARQCAAPEILRGDPYTGAADVWGLGVLLVQLLRGPLKPLCTADLENSDLLSPFISALSPGAASFVLPCLKSAPQARPLLLEVLQHPFLSVLPMDGNEDGDEQGSDDSSTSEGEELEGSVADSR